MPTKVLVAMSGGVDSAVVAHLLKEKGLDVLGVMLKLFPDEKNISPDNKERHLGEDAIIDAKNVAKALNIPLHVVDSNEIFEEKVIKPFIREYEKGKTPNPCVICNQTVKLKMLLEQLSVLKANFIATGHYAKIEYDKTRGRFLLKRALDDTKDQSYVLYRLTQEQLAKTLMPLGEYSKHEIRKTANKLNLEISNKPESQEICFIPDNDYRGFIRKRGGSYKKGPILDLKGNLIATHEGLPFYTVGQRKGLGLAVGYPVYVIDIIPEKNAIIIGEQKDLYSKGLYSDYNNFIAFDNLEKSMKVNIKIRYKSDLAPAIIIPIDSNRVKVEFVNPLQAVTPGQAVVYYEDDIVIGGGTIAERIS